MRPDPISTPASSLRQTDRQGPATLTVTIASVAAVVIAATVISYLAV